jgi:hypothetical protein
MVMGYVKVQLEQIMLNEEFKEIETIFIPSVHECSVCLASSLAQH